MKCQLTVFCSLCIAAAWATSARAGTWTNPILYENGFEDAAYVVGSSIVGVDGWQEHATENGGGGSRTNTEAAAGYGNVLDNFRATAQNVHHVYRGLDNTVSSGTVTLSFDAQRYGATTDNTWFIVDDNSENVVAYLGMNLSGSNCFSIFDGSGYHDFGSLANNQWNQVQIEMHFSGPAAGTYDVTARGPNGSLAGQWLGQAFNNAGASASRLHVRTYAQNSGAQVDNIRLEQGSIIDKIVHGDFDRLEVGTGPDVGSPVGGWSIAHHGSYTEADATYITIAEKPNPAGGTFADDHALRIRSTSSNPSITFAEQLLTEPWNDTGSKLIMTHEHITNADGTTYLNNGNWTFVNGDHSAGGPYVGLHNRSAGGGGHKIRYWGTGVGETALGPYTPGETYEFRTSVDMQTKTFDLFVRGGPEYARWTQIGKQLVFMSSGVSQVDRLQFGDYYGRITDAYIDNVSAVSSADLPTEVLYVNNLDAYSPGVSLVGQNDGWAMGEGSSYPDRARAVPDTYTGQGNIVTVDAGAPGLGYPTSVYQDMDLVVESGTARFSVDAMWEGGVSNSWGYFGLGDSDMTLTIDGYTYAGLRSSAALFGFHGGGQLYFMASDGDYLGGGGTLLQSPATANTWYTFVADVQLTGPDRNTWNLHVYDRGTMALVWEQTGMDFVTDYTDIVRFGAYTYDSAGNGTLSFDNLGVNVPEPGSATLLTLGGLAFVGLVGRRRWR